MLKTNSKQVKQAVYSDFLEMSYNVALGYADTFTGTMAINWVRDWFKASASGRRIANYQEAWQYFMMSSCIGYVAYEDMRNYLKTLLQETDEEADRFSVDQIEKEYCYLFYRAYLQACKDHGIYPYID